ncbi:GNAT family N-acetyltransferase [Butyrivibrio sp. AD3002]|uniref:GNAT family N-acetyltransferase n=1 Tax=Butyrivibrio sp. AD3002 TaxID=1280670 RepID=UPI000677C4BA|nr:GNAT family N-acetyltransferase [Butyrivibrio sp. AD3002]
MITIKESTYDDIKNIQNLWADEDVMQYIWPGGLHETGEAVREWLDRFISARPKQNHYSIFEDGKYCGETQYRIDSETKNASLDIKLFEFARGRGIATQALLYSIQEAFKQGAENLWVDPHPANAKAINLYRKLGFIQKEMPEYVIALGEDPSLYIYMELGKKEFNDKFEKSCGAIVYTIDGGVIKYLLVEEMSGSHSFPKGHMEEGETEIETALREIKEETNLKVELDTEFRASEQYTLSEKPGVTKQVVYFLAKYKDSSPSITRPDEVKALKILKLEDAINTIEYDNKKEMLKKADSYLKNKAENTF